MHSSKIQCLHVYVQDSLKRAGLFIRQTKNCVRCVVCWCVVLCCVVSGLFRGTFLEQLFEPFDGRSVKSAHFPSEKKLLLTWNGKRAFICLRFFPSLLVFSHLFSLLPASSGRAGGPAGRLFTFLPVSSLFFASLLASPRLCGQAGGTTFHVSSRFFFSFVHNLEPLDL